MTERERLIELLRRSGASFEFSLPEEIADYLLANGVILVDNEEFNLVTNGGLIKTAFGMPLDELADLIRAKQRGRIIELPCEVGDTVYLPWMYGGQKGIALCSAERIVVRGEKSYVETSLSSDDDGFSEEYNYGEFYFTDFGKTVFLSREEAEKALERSRG